MKKSPVLCLILIERNNNPAIYLNFYKLFEFRKACLTDAIPITPHSQYVVCAGTYPTAGFSCCPHWNIQNKKANPVKPEVTADFF